MGVVVLAVVFVVLVLGWFVLAALVIGPSTQEEERDEYLERQCESMVRDLDARP